ncbi:hypothetical protein K492DRAFT_197703 [Lichtheimia hyalospora FSU 10163]|nr:hypothetical protein K492DRAFT_197703 [Lichtheimia hyalospora FSU 10163]
MSDQTSQQGSSSSSNHIDTVEQQDPAGRVIQGDEEQAIQIHDASQEKPTMVTANNNSSIVTDTSTKPLNQHKKYRLSQLLSLSSHNSISQQPKTVTTTTKEKESCLADPQQIQTPSSSPASNKNHHHHPHEIKYNTTVTNDPNKTQPEAQTTDQQHLDHHPPPPLPPRSMKKTTCTNNHGTWTSNAFASLGRKSVASVQWVGFRGSMDHRPQNDQLFVVNQDDVV